MLNKSRYIVGILALVVSLAFLDYLTSRFIQLSLFYALIVGAVGWRLGRLPMLGVVVLSVTLTFITDRLADPSVPWILDLANHAFRALLWAVLGFATSELNKRMELLGEANKLIQRELDAGKIVQTGFLSRPKPVDPRFDLGVSFRTARELGGDYFSAKVQDGFLQVVVADVSGKGTSAALISVLFGGHFAELSRRYDNPAKVLRILDKEIAGSLPDGAFVTSFYLRMKLDDGECQYASAGHDVQYLMSKGVAKELGSTGLPVGLLSGFEIEANTFTLLPEESIVLFTDGVLNLKTHDGRMGETPLLEMLARESDTGAQDLTERVFQFLDQKGTLDDDAVVLIVKRL